jgi:hypothetical protein
MEETLISKVFSSNLITSMYSMEDIVIDVKGFIFYHETRAAASIYAKRVVLLPLNLYHETRAAAASIYASLVFVEFAFTLVKALDGQGRPAPCC